MAFTYFRGDKAEGEELVDVLYKPAELGVTFENSRQDSLAAFVCMPISSTKVDNHT